MYLENLRIIEVNGLTAKSPHNVNIGATLFFHDHSREL